MSFKENCWWRTTHNRRRTLTDHKSSQWALRAKMSEQVHGQILASFCVISKKKVREKSRECHNHKPQPIPDPKRKRKPRNPNKHKPNKRTKNTKISSLFPKRGNRNTPKYLHIQLTLVISTSLISNNRLSRSENLVPAYTWKPNNRWKIL